MISDSQNLLTLLDDLFNLTEELESQKQKITDTDLLKRLNNLQNQLNEKRSELVRSQHMNYLVDEIINENDEFNILKLLQVIPPKGPFTKRLREALKIIQQRKNNDEVSFFFFYLIYAILMCACIKACVFCIENLGKK